MSSRPHLRSDTTRKREQGKEAQRRWREKEENREHAKEAAKKRRQDKKEEHLLLQQRVDYLEEKVRILEGSDESEEEPPEDVDESVPVDVEPAPEDDDPDTDESTSEARTPFYDRSRAAPGQFKQMSGLTLPEFDELLEVAEAAAHESGDGKLSIAEQLFLLLIFLRQYSSPLMLASLFGISESTVHRSIRRTLALIEVFCQQQISWPSDDEVKEFVSARDDVIVRFGDIPVVFSVDGTELKIRKPMEREEERKHFSAKKKQHSVTLIAIVRVDGLLVYLSDPQVGACDQRHWNTLNLRSRFHEKHYAIVGDSGFFFNRSHDRTAIYGYTPLRSHAEESFRIEHNAKINKSRCVVENVFAKMKEWKALRGTSRHYSSKLPTGTFRSICRVVGGLVNYVLKRRKMLR
jgi:hypothetical protein